MVEDIIKVDILFEMVAPAVGNNPGVQNMDLSNRPAIESRLRKQFLQQVMTTDLNVATPNTETLHHRLRRNCTFVAMVQDPTDCCQTSVDRRYLQELKLSELVLDSFRDLKSIPMRPTNRICRC